MNLQQLKYVRETVRQNLSLTEAAGVLNTSQSGVSKQIKDLEAELGIEIFVRHGKRFTGLSHAGEKLLPIIENVLQEAENLRRFSEHWRDVKSGRLIIATTHNQARYTLPLSIEAFSEEFPSVSLELKIGKPRDVTAQVLDGRADIAIASDVIDPPAELVNFPCFVWRHIVVVAKGHPLADLPNPSLADVAQYPIITYAKDVSGRAEIDYAFERARLKIDTRLTALDSDVIKLYAARGLGVGIVSEMAVAENDDVVSLDSTRSFFRPISTQLWIKRGTLQHDYAYRFIELFAPQLKAELIRKASIERLTLRPLTEREKGALNQSPDFEHFLGDRA